MYKNKLKKTLKELGFSQIVLEIAHKFQDR